MGVEKGRTANLQVGLKYQLELRCPGAPHINGGSSGEAQERELYRDWGETQAMRNRRRATAGFSVARARTAGSRWSSSWI